MTDAEGNDTTDLPARPDKPIVGVVIGLAAVVALCFAAFSSQFLYAGSTQLQLVENGNATPMGPVHEVAFGLRNVTMCFTSDGVQACRTTSIAELQQEWDTNLLEARLFAGEPVDAELEAMDAPRFATAKAEKDRLAKLFDDPSKSLAQAQRELVAAKTVYRTNSVTPTLGWIVFVALLLAAASLATASIIVFAGKRVRLPVMPTTSALLASAVALICGCLFVAFKPGPPGYVGVGLGFFVFGAGCVLGLWASLKLNKLMRPHDPDLLEDAMKPDEF